MLSQAVLIAAVIDLIGVNIKGGVMWSHCLFHTLPSHFAPLLFFQTEIAKRLNAILAQIMPFLSQEVSSECGSDTVSQFSTKIKSPIVATFTVCGTCPHLLHCSSTKKIKCEIHR